MTAAAGSSVHVSAPTLTPGLDDLEVGQRFMRIFALHSFGKDEHLTLTLTDRGSVRLFGNLTVSYVVYPVAGGRKTRLVVKLALAADSNSWRARDASYSRSATCS